MKYIHTAIVIITLLSLQACSSQPEQKNMSSDMNNRSEPGEIQLVNQSGRAGVTQHYIKYPADTNQQFPVPEAQIIRELYQSGCLIDEFELDRRKQHMRISCVNDKPFGSSI